MELKSKFVVNTTKIIDYQIGNFILAPKWVNPTLYSSYHKIKTFFKSGEPLCLAPFRCFPRCFCLESKKATDGSGGEKQSMFRKNVDITGQNRNFRHCIHKSQRLHSMTFTVKALLNYDQLL